MKSIIVESINVQLLVIPISRYNIFGPDYISK